MKSNNLIVLSIGLALMIIMSTKLRNSNGSRKWVIVALMFLAASCVPICRKEVNADPFGKNDGYSVLGFKVGNTTYQQIVPSWDNVYFPGAGCSMLHCMYFQIYEDGSPLVLSNLFRYDIEQAKIDTLWINALLTCREEGSNPSPAFEYLSLAFAINMKDVAVGDTLDIPCKDVFFYLGRDAYALYPEKYSSYPDDSRVNVNSFSLCFDAIDYKKRMFSGTFYMKWAVDIGYELYSFETDSGVFNMVMEDAADFGVFMRPIDYNAFVLSHVKK